MRNVNKPYRWSSEMRLAATALFDEMRRGTGAYRSEYQKYRREFLARHFMVQVDETTMGLSPAAERPSDGQLRRVWNTLTERDDRAQLVPSRLYAAQAPETRTAQLWPRPMPTYKPTLEAFAASTNDKLVKGYRGLLLCDETPLGIAIPGVKRPMVHTIVDAATETIVSIGMSGAGKLRALSDGPQDSDESPDVQ
jgi:hypothetical protein